MKLIVNGESREFDKPLSIEHLLRSLDLEGRRVAVMVNGEIVRRPEHPAHILSEDDAVDIVHMVGGG